MWIPPMRNRRPAGIHAALVRVFAAWETSERSNAVVDERKARRGMGLQRTVRVAAVAALLTAAAPAVASAAPSQLKVNGAAAPLGIDSAPRFSWDAGVERQSAYELDVSRGASTVWDSGKVTSGDDLD